MTSLRKGLVITIHEFTILVDRFYNGTPAGPGWGSYPDVRCAECGRRFRTSEKLGTKGYWCPRCGYHDPGFMWLWSGPEEVYGEGSTLCPVGWQYSRFSKN